jgi:Xaa-Pro dipeptidase
MRYLEYSLFLKYTSGLAISAADSLISSLRQVKDAEEIRRMKEAVRIVETALAETLPKIKIGMSELELTAELKISLLRAGSGPVPFEPLVQTGATGATPHANPGERQLAEGDLLIIDFGASYQGYPSDLTRTFAVGTIDDKARQIYETVKQANTVGRQSARPGLTCQQLDQAVRRVIDEADYGEYFIHRTGHGLGLEIHEAPYIVEGNEAVLAPGMTFTIEPGIYFQGVGGVRIEDNVVITEDGVEVLTSFARDLITVG